MSERNVHLLKEGFYDHWARGEYPRRPDLWLEDGELALSDDFPEPASARGQADRRKLLEDWLGAWKTFQIEVEEFIAEGDHVLVLESVRGIGKESEVEVKTTGAHLWEMREGKVASFTIYRDRDKARQAMAAKAKESQ
jgi:ketosteroid isomerase-like protein